MILRKLLHFQKIFRKILRIFVGVGIFKGLKLEVPRLSQMKTWYQNVRKVLSYKMSIMRALRSNELARGTHFSEKNVDIYATQWPNKFFESFFSGFESSPKAPIWTVPSVLPTLIIVQFIGMEQCIIHWWKTYTARLG